MSEPAGPKPNESPGFHTDLPGGHTPRKCHKTDSARHRGVVTSRSTVQTTAGLDRSVRFDPKSRYTTPGTIGSCLRSHAYPRISASPKSSSLVRSSGQSLLIRSLTRYLISSRVLITASDETQSINRNQPCLSKGAQLPSCLQIPAPSTPTVWPCQQALRDCSLVQTQVSRTKLCAVQRWFSRSKSGRVTSI
jgi:hypothetical protein